MANLNEKTASLQLLEQNMDTLTALAAINALSNTDTRSIVTQEIEYLRQCAMTTPAIFECIPQTVLWAMKSVIKSNLSFDPSQGLVYVKTRNVSIEVAGKKTWQKALEVTPSANGILSIAYQCGKIIDHKNPVVKKDANGKVIEVEFEFQVASGRWELRTFDESDFMRWRTASHKENGRNKEDANIEKLNYSNPNYTSWKGGIDPEFARAKAIRHGLKKLGTNPNEKYAIKIQSANFSKIEIDETKDVEAAQEEFTPHVEIVETVEHEEVPTIAETPIVNNLNF